MISLVVSPWVSPLAYIPLSFPLLCKSHGENGPNLFETHEELIRFILGPVPERLIAWLRISWGRLWLIFNPASLPSITGEHSSYFMPLFLVFILAESSHPSPPALPGRPAALPCHCRAFLSPTVVQKSLLLCHSSSAAAICYSPGIAAAQHLSCSPRGAAQTELLFAAPDRDPLGFFPR